MKEYYDSVYVVGNIGTPYTEMALNTTEQTVTVAEVSSFQLETTDAFRPDVSAILNITPDHLNRHHNMGNYVAVKERIAGKQTKEDVCVLYEAGRNVQCGKCHGSYCHCLFHGSADGAYTGYGKTVPGGGTPD